MGRCWSTVYIGFFLKWFKARIGRVTPAISTCFVLAVVWCMRTPFIYSPWPMLARLNRIFVYLFLLINGATAQTASQAAVSWSEEHRQQILDRFTSLLSIPNVAADVPNIRRNAETLLGMLKERG